MWWSSCCLKLITLMRPQGSQPRVLGCRGGCGVTGTAYGYGIIVPECWSPPSYVVRLSVYEQVWACATTGTHRSSCRVTGIMSLFLCVSHRSTRFMPNICFVAMTSQVWQPRLHAYKAGRCGRVCVCVCVCPAWSSPGWSSWSPCSSCRRWLLQLDVRRSSLPLVAQANLAVVAAFCKKYQMLLAATCQSHSNHSSAIPVAKRT